MPVSVPLDDVGMVERFDYWIEGYGQPVSIYRPGRAVASGVVTENAPALAGTTTAQFQFGEEVLDMLSGAGKDPNKFCVGFFLSSSKSFVKESYRVQDQEGNWWLIHSMPANQSMPGTIGVVALLERQPDSALANPTGVP